MTKQQKTAIAVGKAAGRTNKQIAQDLGLGVPTVDHLAASPEVTGVRRRIELRNEGRLDKLFAAMVDSLTTDMRHKEIGIRSSRTSQALQVLTTSERLDQEREQAQAARKGPSGTSQGEGGFFLEEILYERRAASASAAPARRESEGE